MPITQIVPHEGGGGWGWDTDAGKWVPVDPQTMQGSLPGNLARAGMRGLEAINLGASQLAEPNAPDIQAKIKNLQLRTGLASEAAPYTEMFGQALPDLAAGALATPFTGGMSLPATLATFGGLGAASGLIRPGTMEDRVTNALYGAAAGVAGVGLGEAAMQGVGAAMRVGESIMTKNAALVARGVEVGGQRVQNAADRAAMEAAAQDTARTGEAGAGGEAIQPGQSTAGAAATPLEQQGAEHAMENAAADLTDQTGANIPMSDAAMAQRARVEDMGYKSPAYADTRKGSIGRWTAGVNETLPWQQLGNQRNEAINQAMRAEKVGNAMGLEGATTLGSHEMDLAQQQFNNVFEGLGNEMPDVNKYDYGKQVLRPLQKQSGLFSKQQGQNEIDNAIKNIANVKGDNLSGAQIMQDRSTLSNLMADFYKNGKADQGDLMRQAIEKLDALVAEKAAAQGNTTLAQRWAKAREQWQVYLMARKPGAISQEGDVNPVTMFRSMSRDRSSGGFGPGGPKAPGPARDAFDLLDVSRRDMHGIPPTGVRIAGALANYGIQGAAPGLIGGTSLGVLNAILGNK